MNAFKRLIVVQSELGLPVVDHYGLGLTETEVKARVKRQSFDVPAGLVSLYATANGSTRNDQCAMHELWVFPNYYMLELDEALTTARYLLDNEPDWLPGWLPLFSSGGAAFVSCDERGRVLRSSPEAEEPSRVISDRLDSFVFMLVESFERGNVRKLNDGLIEWVNPPW